MSRERDRALGLIATCIIVLLAGCAYPLKNNPPESVSAVAGKPMPEERVKASILAAGPQTRIPWEMQEVRPGLIRANLNFKNKHKITLDIPYSANSYQLVYVSSQMMRYEPPSGSGGTAKIGGHYIEWVNQLDEQIKANIRAAAAAS